MPKTQGGDGDEVFELSDLEISTVGLVGKAANRRKYLLFKKDGGNMSDPIETPVEDIGGVVEQLDSVEDVGGLKKAFGSFLSLFGKHVEKADPAPDPDSTPDLTPDPEPVVDPAVVVDPAIIALQEVTKGLQTELEKAQKRAEDAENIAIAERDRRVTQEYVAKAEGLAVPGKPEDLAKLLKWADETDEAQGKVLLEALTAASEAVVQSGIFVGKGTTIIGGGTGEDPFLDAVEVRKAELKMADPTLTEPMAFKKAYDAIGREQQDLARQHIAIRQSETGRK